jgi:PII-like signaling protein
MQFKLILVFVEDDRVNAVLKAARSAGATGATVVTGARGEGLTPEKTFFGLDLSRQRDVVLLVVEEHLSRSILEAIEKEARFDDDPGTGIALQVAIEDAVGLASQIRALEKKVEGEL